MSDRPIPTSKLIPVGAAALIVTAAALLGVPDFILAPMAAITVIWGAVMVARHYMTKKKEA